MHSTWIPLIGAASQWWWSWRCLYKNGKKRLYDDWLHSFWPMIMMMRFFIFRRDRGIVATLRTHQPMIERHQPKKWVYFDFHEPKLRLRNATGSQWIPPYQYQMWYSLLRCIIRFRLHWEAARQCRWLALHYQCITVRTVPRSVGTYSIPSNHWKTMKKYACCMPISHDDRISTASIPPHQIRSARQSVIEIKRACQKYW